uniref:Cytochrome c oxidase subunit 3 n=1 Tax=Xenos vesparum TaxID=31928 RepID=B7ZE91_9NEOP|nr:cytochrome oxidase subunit 3 [Xenos vesparum]
MMKQPFYLIQPNPWPILMSLNLFNLINSMINWMEEKILTFLIMNLFLTSICSIKWWIHIKTESLLKGQHTFLIYQNLKMAMIMFIFTEILLFTSLLWNFFYMKKLNYDMMWPPKFLLMINPYHIPLLNTLILFSSSITITWSHHCLINKNYKIMKISSFITLMLGITFITLQIYEFFTMKFNMNDSIYGSSFYLTTGFHGFHVIIGLMFISSYMIKMKYSNSWHNFNFESASWYWHFVDLVWLFVYTSLYL